MDNSEPTKSLLFIPDISGFTEFIETTEVEHSQHVIAELLEILIESNTYQLQLAEVEGDALFFYKENEIFSLEKLLAQVETMFTSFYSHLKLLETNRICPCKACSSAPNLGLKIIIHSGELQFISVQENRKPFGKQVIEAHRLMKNSVNSDNYVLLSKDVANDIGLLESYQSKRYAFEKGANEYDGKNIDYLYAVIDPEKLMLSPFSQAKKYVFNTPSKIINEQKFAISASELLEYITNYKYRHLWVDGVDQFEYNENETTRIGTEHICVINDKHLNFKTVTKEANAGQLVYGELTSNIPVADELFQFYILTPLTNNSCKLKTEVYWKAKSPIKRLVMWAFVSNVFRKNGKKALTKLNAFIESLKIN
jgi:hypothetical protein